MTEKIMGAIARFLSSILSPLLMPTYGVLIALWASVLCYIPSGTRMVVLMVVMGITCILPMVIIAVLHNTKAIHDKRLIKRQERFIPYLFSIACYIGAAFYLQSVHSPTWLIAYLAGCAASSVVSTMINVVWKISAHLTGIAGVLALTLYIHNEGLGAFNLFPIICITILLCGMLGSSRILLDRHSFLQVLAGTVIGYGVVMLTLNFFG